MNNKDKFYHQFKDGVLIHRSPIKLILDPILVLLQFWTQRPYLIASLTEYDENGQPHFIKYVFRRVQTGRCVPTICSMILNKNPNQDC